MRHPLLFIGLPTTLAIAPLSAQSAPVSDKLPFILSQGRTGFESLKGEPLAAGTWHGILIVSSELDSAEAAAGSTISALNRPRADGSPGKAYVAVFPLANTTPAGFQAASIRFRDQIGAALSSWQNRSTDGGDWSECSDPRRGREVVLSSSRTAGGQVLLLLSITVHPDAECA